MPTLYFVRDGTGPNHTSQGHAVSAKLVQGVCDGCATHYFQSGPSINKGIASPFDPYRHVVIEVDEIDVGGVFDRPGFYLVPELSPEKAQEEFSISQIREA